MALAQPGESIGAGGEAPKPGGVLAIVDTNQVASDADKGYFAASQRIYRKYGEPDPPPPPGPDLVPGAVAELENSPGRARMPE